MNEDIRRKINNLLEMTEANGCTEAEAAAAADAVHRLLLKYNLKLDEVRYREKRADFEFGRKYFKVKNTWFTLTYRYCWTLAGAIGNITVTSFYKYGTDQICIMGEPDSCEMAFELYQFIFENMYRAEAAAYRKRDKASDGWYKRNDRYHSFCTGYIEEVAKRINDSIKVVETEFNCTAIVQFKADALAKWINTTQKIGRARGGRTGYHDPASYNAGREAGRKAEISK